MWYPYTLIKKIKVDHLDKEHCVKIQCKNFFHGFKYEQFLTMMDGNNENTQRPNLKKKKNYNNNNNNNNNNNYKKKY